MSDVRVAGAAAGEMDRLREATRFVLRARTQAPDIEGGNVTGADSSDWTPEIGIILGTGLGGLASMIERDVAIPYADVPHFPCVTSDGHDGRLLLGTLGGTRVVAMQGRPHRYEGHPMRRIAFPVRVMGLMGARVLVVSSACGGMNPLWSPGDIVVLDDHINLMGESPLTGPNLDELGPRFPDMSRPYDPELHDLAGRAALTAGMLLRRGVYVGVQGPQLETRAEYRMLRAAGADVVGMSTVPEVIAARHMGMRVLALAVITDQCLPDALEVVDVARVIAVAEEAGPRLAHVVAAVAANVGRGSGAGA